MRLVVKDGHRRGADEKIAAENFLEKIVNFSSGLKRKRVRMLRKPLFKVKYKQDHKCNSDEASDAWVKAVNNPKRHCEADSAGEKTGSYKAPHEYVMREKDQKMK